MDRGVSWGIKCACIFWGGAYGGIVIEPSFRHTWFRCPKVWTNVARWSNGRMPRSIAFSSYTVQTGSEPYINHDQYVQSCNLRWFCMQITAAYPTRRVGGVMALNIRTGVFWLLCYNNNLAYPLQNLISCYQSHTSPNKSKGRPSYGHGIMSWKLLRWFEICNNWSILKWVYEIWPVSSSLKWVL